MELFKNLNLNLCLKKSKYKLETNSNDVYFVENTQGHNLDFSLFKMILNKEDFINETYSLDKKCLKESLNTK